MSSFSSFSNGYVPPPSDKKMTKCAILTHHRFFRHSPFGDEMAHNSLPPFGSPSHQFDCFLQILLKNQVSSFYLPPYSFSGEKTLLQIIEKSRKQFGICRTELHCAHFFRRHPADRLMFERLRNGTCFRAALQKREADRLLRIFVDN